MNLSVSVSFCLYSVKATVENLRGSVEKLSPKESVKGADTVLRGSYSTLPQGFSTVAQTTNFMGFTGK